MANSFETDYPHIALWVASYGWIEVGQDDYSESFIRALDEGGMVWEGKKSYVSLDAAWQALEAALAKWMEQNG